jgi:hypothetical protein
MFYGDPLKLVPTILLSEIVTGFAASFFHAQAGNVDFSRRSRHAGVILLLVIGSLVGAGIGVPIARRLPEQALKIVIGVIILAAGLCIWVFSSRRIALRRGLLLVTITVASFNKSVSGGGYGPLMTSGQVLGGVEGRAAVGITSFAEAVTCILGFALYLCLSGGAAIEPSLIAPVLAGALLSVPFSAELVKGIRESMLKRAIAVLAMVMGSWTVMRALAIVPW